MTSDLHHFLPEEKVEDLLVAKDIIASHTHVHMTQPATGAQKVELSSKDKQQGS